MMPPTLYGWVRQDRDDLTLLHVGVNPREYLSPEAATYLLEKLQIEQYLNRPIYFEVICAIEHHFNGIIAEAQMSDILCWDYVRGRWGLHAN